MRELIVFTGKAGAGKSLAAGHLMKRGFQRVKFADPLKGMLRALGLGEEELEGSLKNTPCALLGGRSPRHAMVTLGTEWGRGMISENLWVEAWKSQVRKFEKVVTDDCRFLNEAAAVRDMGGIIVRVVRPEQTGTDCPDHLSETEQDSIEVDLTLENSGTVEELFEKVEGLF